jgi:hypothetical protein
MSLFETVEAACEAQDVPALLEARLQVRAALRDTAGHCYHLRQDLRDLLAAIDEVLQELAEAEVRDILRRANCARIQRSFRTASTLLDRLQPGGPPHLLAAIEGNRQLRVLLAAVRYDLRTDWCLCGSPAPSPRVGTYHTPLGRRGLQLSTPRCRRPMKRRI